MPSRPPKTGPNPAVAPPAARASGAAHTQALSRGLAVLDALAATEGGATLTALAQALDLPAPTAHRLLATLSEAGYVTQGDGGRWRVGVRAFRAGSAFLLHRNLVAQAYPFLQQLMDDAGETSNLAVVDEGEAVFVEQVQCRELMRMNARLGARAPLHASGVGKAMLSALDPEGVRVATARRGLVRCTPHTITAPAALAAELAAIRERGYAIDAEEHALGLSCVAAPVFDEHGQAWAALSLAGPTVRLPPARLADLGPTVRAAADALTAALGGLRPSRPRSGVG